MNLFDSRGIQSVQWYADMLIRSLDMNDIGEVKYKNITNFISLIAKRVSIPDDHPDIIVSGLQVEYGKDPTDTYPEYRLLPGIAISFSGSYISGGSFGFVANPGDIFIVVVPDSIAIPAPNTGLPDRKYIAEIRPTLVEYNSNTRTFLNPVTEDITNVPVNLNREYGVEVALRQASSDGDPPPDATAGWIKICEFVASQQIASTIFPPYEGFLRSQDSDKWLTDRGRTICPVGESIPYMKTRGEIVRKLDLADVNMELNHIGEKWYIQKSASDTQWYSVIWSPELKLFVSAAQSSSANSIMTSPDGISWSLQTVPYNAYGAVTWAPELGLLCAVATTGYSPRVMTSPDGVTWTSRTAAASNEWRGIVWAPGVGGGDGLFVAVSGTGSGNRIMTSPDGITWTSRTNPVDNQWRSVAWSPTLGLFAAVSIYTGDSNQVMTSSDGITWTSRTVPTNISWVDIVWSDSLGLFVSVSYSGSGNQVMTSPDGINWTTQTTPGSNGWYGIEWAKELGLLVAVAYNGTGDGIMISKDGINWYLRNTPADNNWRSIAWAPELRLFTATASSGSGNRVMASR